MKFSKTTTIMFHMPRMETVVTACYKRFTTTGGYQITVVRDFILISRMLILQ